MGLPFAGGHGLRAQLLGHGHLLDPLIHYTPILDVLPPYGLPSTV
ncbi:hypothetical protein SMICM304S_11280 [Streptomyces microflavus]